MYNYDKLKGAIKEKFNTQRAFAAAMSMTEPTLCKKLRNESEWTQEEMLRAVQLLGLNLSDIPLYFFNQSF